KDHWYHLRLLSAVCGPIVAGAAQEADKLSDLLGEEHDLAVLKQVLADHSSALAADTDSLDELIDQRREQLQGEATQIGLRLYAVGWGHTVVSTPVTPEALVRMRLNALILDVTAIGPDCWSYLERVCNRLPGLAVIVCSAPSSVAQRVRGLRLGVDAWVTKPCHPEELVCVVEAALRRHRRRELTVTDPPRMVGDLTIRGDLHQVYVDDVSAELTAREFEILQLLAQ